MADEMKQETQEQKPEPKKPGRPKKVESPEPQPENSGAVGEKMGEKEKVDPEKEETLTPVEQKRVLSEAERTKAALEKEPKSQFFIPLMPGEKEGAYEVVALNGYRLTIKKNCLVELPLPIIHILAEHYRISVEAGRDKLISRDDAVVDALTQ